MSFLLSNVVREFNINKKKLSSILIKNRVHRMCHLHRSPDPTPYLEEKCKIGKDDKALKVTQKYTGRAGTRRLSS